MSPGPNDASCPAPVPIFGAHPADSIVVGDQPDQPITATKSLVVNGASITAFGDHYLPESGVLDFEVATPGGSVFVKMTFGPSDTGRLGREILDSIHLA